MAYRVFAAGMVAALVAGNLPAVAQEGESCEAPRFSDVGWTDISATTAMAGMILENLGYQPKIDILSVAVTYEALPRGDIDIFLGNWMPLQVPIQKPLVDAGKIEVLSTNLEGAIIGFAVPKAAYDAGLKTYADIAKFRDELDGKIYGIEAGSSANATISEMIASDKFGLKDFELVEFERAGDAGPGRARGAQRRADRVLRLAAASDEREHRDGVSHRRRQRLRPERRRGDGADQHAARLRPGMPERRQVPRRTSPSRSRPRT